MLDLDAVAAYVVTDDMVEADAVAHFLCSDESPLHSEVLAVVQTSEISAGTAWCAMYQHPNSGEPQAGRISDIHASAALQQMLKNTGDLPALSREEIETRLNSTARGLETAEHKDIIEDALAYVPPIFRDVLQREYEQAATGITQPSTRAVRAALKCFTTPRLRATRNRSWRRPCCRPMRRGTRRTLETGIRDACRVLRAERRIGHFWGRAGQKSDGSLDVR